MHSGGEQTFSGWQQQALLQQAEIVSTRTRVSPKLEPARGSSGQRWFVTLQPFEYPSECLFHLFTQGRIRFRAFFSQPYLSNVSSDEQRHQSVIFNGLGEGLTE